MRLKHIFVVSTSIAWIACLGCAAGSNETSGTGGQGGSGTGTGGGSSTSSGTGGTGVTGTGGAGTGGAGTGGAGTGGVGTGGAGTGGAGTGGAGTGGAGTGGAGTGGMGTGGAGGGGVDCSGVVPQPQQGLGAYYRFENDMGLVCDWSGNANHGVVEGSGVTRGIAGPSGKAIAFGGTDGRVHVAPSSSLDFITGATIELWVRLDDVSQGSVGSTVSRGTGNNDKNVLMNSSCGNMQTIFSTLAGTTNVTSACNAISGGQWTHIAVVNDGTTLTLYLNGAFSKSTPGGQLGPIPSGLYIGRREQGVFPLKGAIDEVKWWTVVRSQAEICGDAGGVWQNGSCLLP